MPSNIVLGRLKSIVGVLNEANKGGEDISRASKGRERELFINMVLSNIISVPFRIGSGDIVDQKDRSSGQADIVIEYANTLSFPSIYPHSERLYLAESVCAVIEVKSKLANQWRGVVDKATEISKLKRNIGAIAHVGATPKTIPVFAVGYEGWKDPNSARDQLDQCNANGLIVSGILQLNPCFYVADGSFKVHSYDDVRGLYGFLLSIEELTSNILGSKPPFAGYVK